MTSEVRYLDANKPQGTWQVVLPRRNDVEYDVDHRGDHFFITLRDESRPNSELLVAPVADPTQTTVRGGNNIPHTVTGYTASFSTQSSPAQSPGYFL